MKLRLGTLLVGFIQSPSPQRLSITNNYVFQNGGGSSLLPVSTHITRCSRRRTSFSSSSKLQVSLTATVAAVNPLTATGFDFKPTLYMSLLAIQFACQPILTKKFTPKSVNRSTVIISQDITKIILACLALLITNGWKKATTGWTIRSWLTVAGIPALLYSIQNFATLVAYQNLAPLTFNVLNQTKTLSAALCCYIFMGKVQSKVQIASLMLLFLSACIIEKLVPLHNMLTSNSASSSKEDMDGQNLSATEVQEKVSNDEGQKKKKGSNHFEGVVAVLVASFISGLAGALTQRNLQSNPSSSLQLGNGNGGRNSYLFSVELSAASLIFVLLSTLRSADGKRIKKDGFFDQWTPRTLIPIITNASGGIIVGLVTKYSGAVKKGFALIFGLVLSGYLQTIFSDDSGESTISMEQILGGFLAAISLWMHSSFPASILNK